MDINIATKVFEENLINLINQSGLPEINILFELREIERLVQVEMNKKIEEFNSHNLQLEDN